MKSFFRYFLRSLPFVFGIILTLTALAFLVDFAGYVSIDALADEEFFAFLVFALSGLPLTLYGIALLSRGEVHDG